MNAQRAEELGSFGAANGMAFAEAAPPGVVDNRFYLFTVGHHDVVGWVEGYLEGAWQGVPVRLFDFAYEDVGGTEAAGESASWLTRTTSTTAMMEIPANLPYVYVDRKDWTTRIADDIDRIDHLHHDHLEVMCAADRVRPRASRRSVASAAGRREVLPRPHPLGRPGRVRMGSRVRSRVHVSGSA